VADQQRAEPDPRALRIGEAADDEVLGRLALHLEPMRRSAVLVRRVAPLRDHPFPALGLGRLPRLRIVERGHAPQRRPKRELLQQRLALVQWKRGDAASVEPEDVEDVVRAGPVPGDFAVEDDILYREVGDRLGQRWDVLRQPVAREEADVRPLLERNQADAVELTLEDPVRAGEAVLCERRRHRLQPIGKHAHAIAGLLVPLS
jgi:hypothetical protein